MKVEIKEKVHFAPMRLLVFGILLLQFGLFPAFCAATTYTMHDIGKVEAPKISGAIGKKLTASGGVTVTSPELTLHADTVTWFFDASGNKIQKLEANGSITFKTIQTGKDGSRTVADGTGDELVYNAADEKITVSVPSVQAAGKTVRKAHVHVVETAAGVEKSTSIHDIRASSITFNRKDNAFDAAGGVEIQVSLPEKPTPAPVKIEKSVNPPTAIKKAK